MIKKILISLCLLSVVILGACNPSQEELDATATQVAASGFATQTANAPTTTSALSPTPTARPTDTPAPTPTARPTDTPAPAPTPTPTLFSEEELLETALSALPDVSFHFIYDDQLTSAEGRFGTNIVGDFQPPDSLQGVFTVLLGDESLGKMELIQIGDTSYLSNTETVGWEVEIAPEPAISQDLAFLTGAKAEDVEDLIFVREETLDGIPVFLLEGTIPSQVIEGFIVGALEDLEGDSQVIYWIGVEDGYLKQVIIEGELSFQGGDFVLLQTTTFSEFGKDVVIEAPE